MPPSVLIARCSVTKYDSATCKVVASPAVAEVPGESKLCGMPISAPRPGFTVVCKGVLSSSVTALMTPACSNIDPAVCATAGNEHADNRAKAKTLLMATPGWRSEEHTSELQSLMRISYAVFCLKKKKNTT